MTDLRFAVRQLFKSPGFAVVAVLTLALGIGLSTTIFNGVNPLLFKSLPFRDPPELVYLNESSPKQGFDRMNISYADFVHWRTENKVFTDVGVWTTTNVTLTGGDMPERIEGCQMSATLFSVLGIAPAIGRGFHPTEDQPGSAPVVLIGDALWRRRFGSNPAIVGQTLQLNGTPHTVVGIMPRGVRFPNDADLWLPIVISEPEKQHGSFSYVGAARLKPGVSLAQATTDLNEISDRMAHESPGTNTNIVPVVRPIEDGFIDGELRAMGWTMLGAVAFVLAVACANVASLFLTRALGRQREFAIRAALGANRWRTVRQLLVESLLVGAIAGVLGLLFCVWGLDLVLGLVPVDIPYWINFSLDGRVLAFAVLTSFLTSILFGLAPAWQASRVNVVSGLTDASRGSSGGRGRNRLRRLFVIAEVAMATLLLCGTGMMIRSLLNLQRVNPGFNPARLAVFYLDLTPKKEASVAARTTFYTTLLEQLRAVPGVRSAAACSRLPLSGSSTGQVFTIEGRPPPADGVGPVGNLRVITPSYFSTMEIPLLAGRDFTAADSANAPKVMIIDAALARQQFGNDNPVGRRIRWSAADPASSWLIVGVAADVRHSSLDRESRPGFYIPHAQSPNRGMAIVMRTSSDEPLGIFTDVRRVLKQIDPTLPLFRVQSMRSMIDQTFWIRRFLSDLLISFAALALGLAAIGIASVVGYAVTQRTQEIGIRMALGAIPADVLRLVLSDGMRLVVAGLVIGLVGSIGLAQLLSSQLYGVGWLDPLSLGASALLFTLVALLACWVPARRATRVSPVTALRAE